MDAAGLRARLQLFPIERLIFRPTPFGLLQNLTRKLKSPEIYVKRDDLTGLAFGGNKSRKLEYIIPDMLAKRADTVVTWASVQSNWCLQTAAAARKFGIKPVLLLFKTHDLPDEPDGNLLLDHILGAQVRMMDAEPGKIVQEDEIREIMDELVQEIMEWGYQPYVVPIGGSSPGWSMDKPLGAVGYVDAFLELWEQLESHSVVPDAVVHATGSGGTQAGLTLAAKIMNPRIKVLGISVSEKPEKYDDEIWRIIQATREALEIDVEISSEDVHVMDDYIGEGYGILDQAVTDAIQVTAETEGFFLDPSYTGKAMAGLMDLIEKGYFKKRERIVFWHTGGTPALFPNKQGLMKFLSPVK
jgi:D-cysteine desulfhydrase family pyridoxal phosphate-dependent enzyme